MGSLRIAKSKIQSEEAYEGLIAIVLLACINPSGLLVAGVSAAWGSVV
jgi:hypothetical protein